MAPSTLGLTIAVAMALSAPASTHGGNATPAAPLAAWVPTTGGGDPFRGKGPGVARRQKTAAGGETPSAAAAIRRLAIQRLAGERSFELRALHHGTYLGFPETGFGLRRVSKLRAEAAGFVRLS